MLKPAQPGARQPQARLLFLVDQLEELFTNDKIPSDARSKFARLLTSLASDRLSQTWVIATLRSDFYAPLTQVPELAALKEGLGQYDLASPTPAEIGLLVREPASAAGLRFEQKPEGERLDDVLRDEASQDPSLLPLLEFTLNELYDRRTDRGRLTFAAYQDIGGVKGALAQRAESTFAGLAEEVQRELPAIFRQLVTIGTLSDETPTGQQTPLARFAGSPARRQFVQAFIAARLFVSDHADDGSAVVRITHESLLARWERLQRWLASDRELLRVKARVERAAARWLQEDRRADLLLTAGKPLQEAEQLHASGFELEPEVQAMIAASRQRADRNRRLRQAAILSLAVLTLAASGLAVVAQIQRGRANENARQAKAAQQATEQANRQLQKTNLDLDAARKSAETESRRAVTAFQAANRQLALSYIDRGVHELEQGDRWRGLAILGQAYRVTGDTPDLRPSVRSLLGAWDGALPRTLRQDNWVYAVWFSPDGAKIATVSNKTRFWDTSTGKPLGEPLPRVVAFSSDGTKFATASDDRTVRLWDAITGRPLGEPLPHDLDLVAVAFSPDGTRLVIACSYTVRVWETFTGEPLGEPLKPGDRLKAVAFSPDGTKLASAAQNGTARLWDAATGKPLGSPLQHGGLMNAVAFSPDGTKLATASTDDRARLWDVATGKPLGEPLRHDGTVTAVAFSPDGTKVATASRDQTVRLWDPSTGKPLGEPLRHSAGVNAVVFSPDGTQLAAASDGRTVQLWDATTGRPLGEPLKHDLDVLTVAFSPDGTQLATASGDRTARLWDRAAGGPLVELPHDGKYWGMKVVAFSPDGTKVATASGLSARLWEASTGRPLGEPLLHKAVVDEVVFSRDGTKIATTSEDQTVRLWDATTGRPLGEPFERVLAFSPDVTKIATASDDRTARLWDATTGKPLGEPLEHDLGVGAVVFSPDARKIAIAGYRTRLWDAATGKPLGEPLANGIGLLAVAFSPDGTKIATASDSGAAQLWDASTGKRLGGPLMHGGKVAALVFSPDGTKLATASSDNTARLWDVSTGKPIGGPLKHDDKVAALIFSPNAAKLATTSWDTVRLWDAATGTSPVEPIKLVSQVHALAFSPDSAKIATTSGELDGRQGEARLWDVVTGKPLGEPLKHPDVVSAVAFSPDGTKIATATLAMARLWNVPRAIPDDPRWLAAYVSTVSQWREDADHSLHLLSAEGARSAWRDVLKSPTWLDDRSAFLQRCRRTLHASEADRQEAAKNWFAAAFHLHWLCAHEPKNADCWKRLGSANAEQRHWAESHRAYEVAQGLLPGDPTLGYSAGLAALAGHDLPALRRELADLLTSAEKSSRPGDWFTAAALAAISDAKEIPRAKFLDLARKTIAADADDGAFRAILGASLYRAGDDAQAVNELQKAIALQKAGAKDPGQGVESYLPHTFLALAYQRLGKAVEVKEQRTVLAQIGLKSPAASWRERAKRAILDAEVLAACGPADQPENK